MPSIESLDKKVDTLLRIVMKQQAKPKTMVNVSVIQELTGWVGSSKMRWARENGLVKGEKSTDGYKYELESLHPLFIINKPCL